MTSEFPAHFASNYQCLLNRLKLHGMQPKTIALYSHGIRRAGDYFDYRIDDLTRLQLTDYFVHIVDSLSWSSLKHDLYGPKFYYAQVLNKPWPGADLVKPPKSHTLRLKYGVGSPPWSILSPNGVVGSKWCCYFI